MSAVTTGMMVVMRWWGVLVLSIVATGCIEDDLVRCSDGTVCPVDNVCVPGGCVTNEQVTACVGLVDGDLCDTRVGTGRCNAGACTVAACGDGALDAPEECDGTAFGSATCVNLGYYGGDLTCGTDCMLVEDACTGRCGDGEVNGGESCDGIVASGCFDVGFSTGRPACQTCVVDISSCQLYGWRAVLSSPSLFQGGTRAGDSLFAVADGTVYRFTPGQPVQTWVLSYNGVAFDMSATSASDVYLYSGREALHFDGTTWSSLEDVTGVPQPSGGFAVSPTLAYLAGSGDVLDVWNGTTWAPFTPAAPARMQGIVANAAGEIWGIEDTGTSSTILHYFDGNNWSEPAAPDGLVDLAISDGIVIGVGGDSLIARWSGTAMEQVAAPPNFALDHVHDIGGGRFVATAGMSGMLEYDGREWTVLHPPSSIDINPAVAMRVDAAGRMTLAGGYRLYKADIRITDDVGADDAILVSREAVWAKGNPNLLRNRVDTGIAVPNAVSVWSDNAVDETVFVSNGASVSRCLASSGSCVTDAVANAGGHIHGTSKDDVWVVGASLTHWNGLTWTPITTGLPPPYFVHAVSSTDVWIANDNYVAHYDGVSWTKKLDTTGVYALIAFPGNVAIVATTTDVVEYDGTTWTTKLATPVLALAGTSPTDVYGVAAQQLFHRDAAGWIEIELPEIPGTASGLQATEGDLWFLAQNQVTRLSPAP